MENLDVIPLVENKEAQRNSKHRTRSTIITIPITSVTKEVIKDTLITKLIPSIKDNFPKDTSTIIIQLDGSSAHSVEEDTDIKRSVFDNDLPIIFRKNPP